MAIVEVVKWNATPDLYAWKFPSEELATWSQLIVSETQEAVLLRGGQMVGPFLPGRHTLSTENIPVLSKFVGIPFGGRSPFTAEVWFVNKVSTLDVKWGTADPIQLLDPKYQVMLPVRAFGQFGVQVEHTKKFLNKLVGTQPSFDRQQLSSYFRGLMLTRVKDSIAKKLVKDSISILEISAHLNDISKALQDEMTGEFAEFGLKFQKFFVNSINTPEDDSAVQRLKEALAKKAEMNIVGYTYQQEKSFDTLKTAAGNPGAGTASLMGAGIGLGMGVGLGGAMGGAMGGMAQVIQPTAGLIVCPACKGSNQPGTRFCSSCGGALQTSSEQRPNGESIVCDKCSTRAPKGSKFCPNCAHPFNPCPKCGADNPEGQQSCKKCGGPMPSKCAGCGSEVPAGGKFCLNCGKPMFAKCAKCDTAIPPAARFCPSCGTPAGGEGK